LRRWFRTLLRTITVKSFSESSPDREMLRASGSLRKDAKLS
jgi:hypothetical protein